MISASLSLAASSMPWIHTESRHRYSVCVRRATTRGLTKEEENASNNLGDFNSAFQEIPDRKPYKRWWCKAESNSLDLWGQGGTRFSDGATEPVHVAINLLTQRSEL